MKKYLNLLFLGIVLILSIIIIINNKKTVSENDTQFVSDTLRLWDGETLAGWTVVLADTTLDPAEVWSVQNGVLRASGDYAYLETKESFSDYRLLLEWRWPETPVNSGVFLHISGPGNPFPPCIECQLKNGNAGDFITIGGTSIAEKVDSTSNVIAKRHPSSEMPAGEWNRYDIRVMGDSIAVYVNDILQNTASRTSVTEGPIGLQSEGGVIEFRNIYLLK